MAENLIIRPRFERVFDREDLSDWETRGVYINLGGDPVRTARVGEGWVDHRAAASWRTNDCLLACDLGATLVAKRNAQIVEWLILAEYKWRMGRLPRRNRQAGKSTIVLRSLTRRDRIRVRIGGHSPLNGRRLGSVICADIELDDDGDLCWAWY